MCHVNATEKSTSERDWESPSCSPNIVAEVFRYQQHQPSFNGHGTVHTDAYSITVWPSIPSNSATFLCEAGTCDSDLQGFEMYAILHPVVLHSALLVPEPSHATKKVCFISQFHCKKMQEVKYSGQVRNLLHAQTSDLLIVLLSCLELYWAHTG